MSLLRGLLGHTIRGKGWLSGTSAITCTPMLSQSAVVTASSIQSQIASLSSAAAGSSNDPSSSSSAPAALHDSSTLVAKLLSPELMSRKETFKLKKTDIVQQFQRFPGDVGSCEIQVAIFTEKIRSLEPHFAMHRKDHSSRRGLTKLIHQRRKLLEYMRRSMFERYMALIQRLGLKDIYFKQARLDTYKLGTRLGTPAEPRVRHTRVSTVKEADKASRRKQLRKKKLSIMKGRR